MLCRALWATLSALCLAAPTVIAQEPAITPAATVDQALLDAAPVPLTQALPPLLRSGARFFNTPYQPYNTTTGRGDGYGEGPVYNAAKGAFDPKTGQGMRWHSKSVFYRCRRRPTEAG